MDKAGMGELKAKLDRLVSMSNLVVTGYKPKDPEAFRRAFCSVVMNNEYNLSLVQRYANKGTYGEKGKIAVKNGLVFPNNYNSGYGYGRFSEQDREMVDFRYRDKPFVPGRFVVEHADVWPTKQDFSECEKISSYEENVTIDAKWLQSFLRNRGHVIEIEPVEYALVDEKGGIEGIVYSEARPGMVDEKLAARVTLMVEKLPEHEAPKDRTAIFFRPGVVTEEKHGDNDFAIRYTAHEDGLYHDAVVRLPKFKRDSEGQFVSACKEIPSGKFAGWHVVEVTTRKDATGQDAAKFRVSKEMSLGTVETDMRPPELKKLAEQLNKERERKQKTKERAGKSLAKARALCKETAARLGDEDVFERYGI